jgi:hypothetical protein
MNTDEIKFKYKMPDEKYLPRGRGALLLICSGAQGSCTRRYVIAGWPQTPPFAFLATFAPWRFKGFAPAFPG